jgi:lysine-specific demethylase 8
MKLYTIYLFCAIFTYIECKEGHLQKLGAHRPPEGVVEEVDYVPLPKVFQEFYSSKSVPLLMKGVYKDSRAYRLWNDEYLMTEYADVIVDVEEGKKEDRDKGLDKIPLREFLPYYQKEDAYVVTSIPREMRDDVLVLSCLTCGGATNRLADAIMWFSSGGTKSVLHYDGVDNINCVLDGWKEVFLIDKKHKDLVDIDHPGGSYCGVDVDRVDMNKYPGLGKVPWYSAKVEAGDCLFIPFRWFHQIRSYGSRNLAVNLWWAPVQEFNYTDCDIYPPLPSEPHVLSEYEMNSWPKYSFTFMDLIDGKPVSKQKFISIMEVRSEKLLNLLPK